MNNLNEFSLDLWKAGWVPVTSNGTKVLNLVQVGELGFAGNFEGSDRITNWYLNGQHPNFGSLNLMLQEPVVIEVEYQNLYSFDRGIVSRFYKSIEEADAVAASGRTAILKITFRNGKAVRSEIVGV